MKTIAAIAREEDRAAQASMWPRLNPPRRRVPFWLSVTVALGVITAAELAAAAWLLNNAAPAHVMTAAERSASNNPL